MEERPLYHSTIRAGYIHQTEESFWFLYRDSNGILQIDKWSMNAIRNGTMRFYKYFQSPNENLRYLYATVHNDSTYITYEIWTPLAGSLDHLNFTLTLDQQVRYYIVTMNPLITDTHYRYTNGISSESVPSSPTLTSQTVSPLFPPPPLVVPLSQFPIDTIDLDILGDTSEDEQVREETGTTPFHIEDAETNLQVSTQLVNILTNILLHKKELLIQPPNKRVCNLVIEDAIKQNSCCPITMNPLTHENAKCVAPCYHVFEKEAIETWLSTSSSCPQCREPCIL